MTIYYFLLVTETCPFCDEILPNPMSYKMKSALDKLNNNNNQGI